MSDPWTWSELIWFNVVTTGLHFAIVSILGSALVLIERFGFFQAAKIQSQPNKYHTDPDMWQCIRHVCIQNLTQFPTLSIIYAILKWRGMPFEGPLPSWPEMISQMALFYFIEDALFYWMHRLFHTRLFYKPFHKFHHRYHAPIGFAVDYAHPFELLIGNTLPFYLGPFLFKAHVKTIWLWLAVRAIEGIDGHSGYDFWFSPYRYFPFRPGASVHHFHHSHNTGNYGSFFLFWDAISGTDQPYRNYVEKMAAKEKEQ